MRFFTPELVMRYTSSDEAEADAASDDWEAATDAYKHHLSRVFERARGLSDFFPPPPLHDAAVVNATDPFPWFRAARPTHADWRETYFRMLPDPARYPFYSPAPDHATVVLFGDDRFNILTYSLWDPVRLTGPADGWEPHGGRVLWLYDELDLLSERRGLFMHRVLFSDGLVAEFPFANVTHLPVLLEAPKGRRGG